jgi:cellobiose phosphorylase
MSSVLREMSGLCIARGDREVAEAFFSHAAALEAAAAKAWDGGWFVRAFYDDGSPLGSKNSQSCKIDSIAQSFAALSGRADRQQVSEALLSAVDILVKPDGRIVLLFSPPFGDGDEDPGYIKGYLPGIRENGGQYTHAAVWLAAGLLAAEKNDEGYAVLDMLLPATHPQEIYRAEPYVLAADVYSNPAHTGRGGWSWYTGAAGWYLRTVFEQLLGIRVTDGRLTVRPALSARFPCYSASLRLEGKNFEIQADENGVTVNGKPCPEEGVRISQGSHIVSKLRVENSTEV